MLSVPPWAGRAPCHAALGQSRPAPQSPWQSFSARAGLHGYAYTAGFELGLKPNPLLSTHKSR